MNKDITSNKEYLKWFADIKERIRTSQLRAALKVNHELLSLYWQIGEALATKETEWGDKFIDNLARDLKVEFPDTTGYSKSNLKYMRRWYAYYSGHSEIGQQVVDQLSFKDDLINAQQVFAQIPDKFKSEISQQPVDLNLYSLLISIPWGHHTVILTKINDPEEAVFYIVKTIQNGWSRSILQEQIESDLYNRQGRALTNFDATLPSHNSDYAKEILKNPYNFDFLTLEEDVKEREFERALIRHIKKFLLELGKGFAYVGNQYNLNVEGDDYFLDLLFFNYNLNCFVIFELKVGDFKPEYAGKVNFYINTIDEQIRKSHHKDTIGVLLCKTPNKTVVEFSIKGIKKPLGVSEYMIKKALPKELKTGMPTVKELEQELNKEIEVAVKPIDEKLHKLKNIISKSPADELKENKSKETVKRIIDKVLVALVKGLDERIKKVLLPYYSESTLNIHEPNKNFKSIKEYLDNYKEDQDRSHIKITYGLHGFRKAGTNTFSINLGYQIDFEQYYYSIFQSGIEKGAVNIKRLYQQIIERSEMEELVDKLFEQLIDDTTTQAEKFLNYKNSKK